MGTNQRALGQIIRIVIALILGCCILVQPVMAIPAPQTLTNVSHSYLYGEWMRFRLGLPIDVDAEQATIHLQIDDHLDESFTVPVQDRVATWERDLSKSPIPAYAVVTYWWTIEEGTSVESSPLSFRHDDNRFNWHRAESSGITVYWLDGDDETMRSAVKIAWDAHTALEYALDTLLEESVDIYIYPSEQDLQSALGLGMFDWVGGMAYPELGVIAVAIPFTDETVSDMKRIIPHELTHKALYDALGKAGYLNLPLWLNEGLAAGMEQSPNVTYALKLEQAVNNHTLIPLDSLCRHLPEANEDVILSYAQSQSFVRYLQRNYGWEGMRDLIAVYTDGFGCEEGISHALGEDLTTLEAEWHAWLVENSSPSATPVVIGPGFDETQETREAILDSAGPWLLIGGLMVVPVLAVGIGLLRRRR